MKRISKKSIFMFCVSLIFLVLLIMIMSTVITKNSLEKEIYTKLNVTTFSPRSEYGKVSEEELHDLIWQIKGQSGLDIIIFEDDIVKISTIKNIDMMNMSDDIYSVVYTGQEYYSKNLVLNNASYYGYFYPIVKNGNYVASILACCASDNVDYTTKSLNITIALIAILLSIIAIHINGKIKSNKGDKNMWFCDAIEFLKKGYKIKRKDWKGYWRLEDGEVIMHCANSDGDELTPINIKDTDDILYTLSNIAADDWEVVLEKK